MANLFLTKDYYFQSYLKIPKEDFSAQVKHRLSFGSNIAVGFRGSQQNPASFPHPMLWEYVYSAFTKLIQLVLTIVISESSLRLEMFVNQKFFPVGFPLLV